jgi:hypothetical protein
MTVGGLDAADGGDVAATNAAAAAAAGGEAPPAAAADALRDLAWSPLVSGFIQGFATVAMPIWRDRRAARRAARAAAARGVPSADDSVLLAP